MAQRTLGDIKNDILVKGQISTTLAFYTDTILGDWVNNAYKWASAYHKWPFTEGRVSTTWASSTEEWNFEGYKADSFRFLQVGGKRFNKVGFSDYQIYREDQSSGKDKIYTDFARTVFINPNADVSGTLTAWGQYMPIDLDKSVPGEITVFSDNDEEGNDAIVNEVLGYMAEREKKTQESIAYHQKAVELLENVWRRVQDEQFGYLAKDREMFKRIVVEKGALRDDIFKRDQFY